jgi:FkbM family methyltransferase
MAIGARIWQKMAAGPVAPAGWRALVLETLKRRFVKLFTHPAFVAAPATTVFRTIGLMLATATGRQLNFTLTPAGERLTVTPNLKFTAVTSYILRDWTEPELRYLHLFLKPGDTFVDVGANIGLFALRAASLVGPNGRVVAVEPGADALRMLHSNLAVNPQFRQIEVHPIALADKVGTATLHHSADGYDPQAFTLLDDGSAGEVVETLTLDELMRRSGNPKVDAIKIDVEGFEPMVLAGALETIRAHRPKIVFEMNAPPALRQGNQNQAWDMLAAENYRFQLLVDGRLVDQATAPTIFGNVIALPK